MTPTTQDEAILKKLGWRHAPAGTTCEYMWAPGHINTIPAQWLNPQGEPFPEHCLPDLNDLQVIRDLLEKDAPDRYWMFLADIVNGDWVAKSHAEVFQGCIKACRATSAQRKDAFCRLHGLKTK